MAVDFIHCTASDEIFSHMCIEVPDKIFHIAHADLLIGIGADFLAGSTAYLLCCLLTQPRDKPQCMLNCLTFLDIEGQNTFGSKVKTVKSPTTLPYPKL